jgi:hypothetical protein
VVLGHHFGLFILTRARLVIIYHFRGGMSKLAQAGK